MIMDYGLLLYPAVALSGLSLCLALHHLYVHSRNPHDHAREESCALCCYLQPSDMANHEIWVISLLAAAATWVIAGVVFMD